MAALVGIFDRALWGPNEGPAGLTSDLYFSVELSEAATSIVTVAYEFIDGTALNGQDFTAANGVLTFEKGEQKKQIRVTVNGDNLDERLEFFELRLKDAIGATIVKSGEYGNLYPYSYAYLQDDDRGNPPLNYKIYSEKVLLNNFNDPLFGIVKLPPDILRFIDKPGYGASVIGFGDLNSDDYDDIVYAPSYQGDSRVGGTIKPLVMFFNPTKGAFEFDEQFQALLTEGRYPRRAVISDFDGDGRNDLFIGDTDEFQIVGGAQNQLYLQSKEGWVSATNRLPQYIDYTHGVVPADFDLDGRMDLLVLNSIHSKSKYPEVTMRSYVLTFQEDGTILERKLDLAVASEILFDENELIALSELTYLSGLASELNGDGYPDLILALSATSLPQDTGKMVIFESTGPFKYAPAKYIDPPQLMLIDLNKAPHRPFQMVMRSLTQSLGQVILMGMAWLKLLHHY